MEDKITDTTNFSRIIKIILFITLFSSSYVFFKTPFEFYFHYIIFIVLIPLFFIKYGFPKLIIQLLALPLAVGIIQILLNNCDTFIFLKVFGGLLATLLFYYYIILYSNFNINMLFTLYIKFCYILAIIGCVQLFSYIMNFNIGYDYNWIFNKWGVVKGGLIGIRVNSILSEPAQLAIVLSPAVYISIHNLLHKDNFILNKYQSIIIITISILTTSSVGYIGILISLLLNTNSFRLRYIFIGIGISISSFFLAYNYVPDFKSRMDSAIGLWIYQEFNIKNTNNSSFVVYNNVHIAKENLKHHPIFGTGIGSHEDAFKKHTLTETVIKYDFAFNQKDGNSLLVRLTTETGIIGISFISLLLIKGYINRQKNYKLEKHSIISKALLMIIILSLIRQGNYMMNGLPLIFLIYYYNYVSFKNKISA